MATLYPNLKGGTITDNPLAIGATTINSAGFANLPVVTSPDILWLTLDPDALVGAPEIVKVTAHSSAATSVTVARGQQSTTARAHNLAEVWNCVLTEQDLAIINTPDWTAWTPVGNMSGYTAGGKYIKLGKLIIFHLKFNITNAFVTGNDTFRITGWPYQFATGSNVRQTFAATVDTPHSDYPRLPTTAYVNTSTEVVVLNPAEFVAGTSAVNSAFLDEFIDFGGLVGIVSPTAFSISGTYETT